VPAILVTAVVTVTCGLVPQRVPYEDPRLTPMFDAMARVDRRAMRFTTLDRRADIRVEWVDRSLDSRLGLGQKNYDAMLHVEGKTSRTVAFRQTQQGYEWLGEQETFKGPRTYTSVDGRFNETITVTYDRVPISGFPVNTTAVVYAGEESELAWPRRLDLDAVRPWLKKWGYY
jgi:hypothetical protein